VRTGRDGHVFVIRGTLHQVLADDLLISTDRYGSVEETWYQALGWDHQRPPPVGQRPQFGNGERVCLVPAGSQNDQRKWFVDVGTTRPDDDVAWLLEGVRQALEAAASAGRGSTHRGPRQRIAMPVMGVGRGGFDSERGAVISGLLRTAHDVAARHGVDVVLVAFRSSDYSALQAIRLRDHAVDLAGESERMARELAEHAKAGQLALFLGAGTGVPAGLPSWGQLLKWLAERLNVEEADGLKQLNPLDAAEVLRRAAEENAAGDPGLSLGDLVAARIDHPRRYALSHILLAALGAEHVITTNFDQLYETAVEAIAGAPPPVILPGDPVTEIDDGGVQRGWLLKLHGDVDRPKDIVLDRRSFVRYDANRRPLGGVLQTTLLTKHLLVVGASMTDDNVIRLVHEVAALDEGADRPTRRMGTVLTLSHEPLRRRLWKPEFEHLELRDDSGILAESGRRLEIFLDRVALLSAPRHTHLLDPRYGELLRTRAEKQLATELDALVARIEDVAREPDAEPSWPGVAAALRAFGAEGRSAR
jgi:hypothetical protein